jgi:hypothetical protein
LTTSAGAVNSKTFWDYFDINNALNSVLNFSLGMWGKNSNAQGLYAATTSSNTSGFVLTPDGQVVSMNSFPWRSVIVVGIAGVGVYALYKLFSGNGGRRRRR